MTSASVSPDQWGSSNRSLKSHVGDSATDWDSDVCQDTPYFTGQLVSHGIFGSGRVVRVEGTGDDTLVTVDFFQAGHKHINPKYTTLTPVD